MQLPQFWRRLGMGFKFAYLPYLALMTIVTIHLLSPALTVVWLALFAFSNVFISYVNYYMVLNKETEEKEKHSKDQSQFFLLFTLICVCIPFYAAAVAIYTYISFSYLATIAIASIPSYLFTIAGILYAISETIASLLFTLSHLCKHWFKKPINFFSKINDHALPLKYMSLFFKFCNTFILYTLLSKGGYVLIGLALAFSRVILPYFTYVVPMQENEAKENKTNLSGDILFISLFTLSFLIDSLYYLSSMSTKMFVLTQQLHWQLPLLICVALGVGLAICKQISLLIYNIPQCALKLSSAQKSVYSEPVDTYSNKSEHFPIRSDPETTFCSPDDSEEAKHVSPEIYNPSCP